MNEQIDDDNDDDDDSQTDPNSKCSRIFRILFVHITHMVLCELHFERPWKITMYIHSDNNQPFFVFFLYILLIIIEWKKKKNEEIHTHTYTHTSRNKIESSACTHLKYYYIFKAGIHINRRRYILVWVQECVCVLCGSMKWPRTLPNCYYIPLICIVPIENL